MAEEIEEVEYQLIKDDGTVTNNSRDMHNQHGRARYTNQDTYDGWYVNGQRSGYGKYFYRATEDYYEGWWAENKKHGIGKMVFKDKGVYQGYFESGVRHGEGTFTYVNGDLYSGWWQDGKKHGKGTFVQKSTGMKIKGQWTNGELIKGE